MLETRKFLCVTPWRQNPFCETQKTRFEPRFLHKKLMPKVKALGVTFLAEGEGFEPSIPE